MGNLIQGAKMENRWSDRRDLFLGVDVNFGSDKFVVCKSRDVGLGGVFLNVNSTDEFRLDSSVELVFHLFDGSQETKYVLRARVVRIARDGIGLKFHDFDTSVFRALQQLMCYRGIEAVH
jgi:hypothetical protein